MRVGDLPEPLVKIDGTVDEAEGDTENIRNRPHYLPLEIQAHNPFFWVERVRANYGGLRRGCAVWSSFGRSSRPVLVCSDLVLTNYPNMGTVILLSLANGFGGQPTFFYF